MTNYEYHPSKTHRYFIADPGNGDTFFFATEAERDAFAADLIKDCLDVDGWYESVEDIYVGEVTHLTARTNVTHRPSKEPDESVADYHERLEAERERIRKEEQDKLAAEAKRLADEKAAADAKAAAEAATAAAAPPVSPPSQADAAATPTMTATVAAVVPQAAVQTSGYIAPAPQLSDRAAAFLASREWPNQAARNSARAVLIEFERFCANGLKAAA